MGTIKDFVFVGPDHLRPDYAEAFDAFLETGSVDNPNTPIGLLDEAALYFTSGTTGDPKPILLTHKNLEFACVVENRHHNQTHDDNFLCIPPLYHTGAKMHWFWQFYCGGKRIDFEGDQAGVDLRGRIRRAGYHSLAAGTMGTGHPC